ncbi:MAG: DNA polymerase III subunit beta [Oscillospiraceae bacterium]|jgi:DNA polymerase-3 subunit beta|nr:DNA polymerase III subunit beta [Oscillospiraceae bacterium]
MKFTCEKDVLANALSGVIRSAAVRSDKPILEGIHIKSEKLNIKIESYNMEFGIQTNIDANKNEDGAGVAKVFEEGAVVVPAKIFMDIVKKLPSAPIEISSEKTNVKIVCGDCKFSISGFDSSDFPKLPVLENEKSIILPAETLKSMIQQTIFAVGTEDGDNSVHTGVLFEILEQFLTLVSIDGFRLALRREPVSIKNNIRIVIPGKALNEVLRLISNDETDVEMFLSERYIFFKLKNYILLSRLLEGEFIDYKTAIPKESTMKIKVKSRELISVLERVSIVINDRLQNPVRAMVDVDHIKFSCSAPLGRSSDEISVDSEGAALEIAFNDKFMIDALKNSETDKVLIEMTTSIKPIKITPIDGDSFLFLVLPVRIRDDE